MTASEVFTRMHQSMSYRRYDCFDAWYCGDMNRLRAHGKSGSFWKRVKFSNKLHVPLAADIAVASADLLFGEPPSIYTDDESMQERLTYILDCNDFYSLIHAAAENCAAMGDAYLKINWDKDMIDCPIISAIPADCSYPDYEQGILRGIHFFGILDQTDTGSVTWVYEHYGKGFIDKQIYKGTKETLGKKIEGEKASTGVDDILAVHIPNLLPNRYEPFSKKGRSDYDGLLSMLDALDETYSSWVRDMTLGKARLIVPTDYLRVKKDPTDENQAVYHFDKEEDLYVAMDMDTEKINQPIMESQFEIRSEQHLALCAELLERIISSAGYSPQSFGLHVEGRADSGTALSIRERKTFVTKSKKELYWKTRLQRILQLALRVDKEVFLRQYGDTSVSVEIKDVSGDMAAISQTVELLSRAQALSTYTKVQMSHPDWTDEKIQEEVRAIQNENGITTENPDDLTI